ncbi:MAG TPA: hypothetical protein PLX50_08235 [Candidatus Aminicenantes bacterium]|nr:hypothetical protein [Candidatus Aminicenantes bacterium]
MKEFIRFRRGKDGEFLAGLRALLDMAPSSGIKQGTASSEWLAVAVYPAQGEHGFSGGNCGRRHDLAGKEYPPESPEVEPAAFG